MRLELIGPTADSGRLDQRRLFSRVTRDGVVWSDGTTEPVDTVLFATGCRPNLDYLQPLGALRDGQPLHTGGPPHAAAWPTSAWSSNAPSNRTPSAAPTATPTTSPDRSRPRVVATVLTCGVVPTGGDQCWLVSAALGDFLMTLRSLPCNGRWWLSVRVGRCR